MFWKIYKIGFVDDANLDVVEDNLSDFPEVEEIQIIPSDLIEEIENNLIDLLEGTEGKQKELVDITLKKFRELTTSVPGLSFPFHI